MGDNNVRGRLAWREDPGVWVAVGRTIKVERTARGWERKELAERAGLSYPYLSEIENGAKRASSKALGAIAEAFGFKVWELLERAETMSPASRRSFAAEEPVAPSVSSPSWFHAGATPRSRVRTDRAELLRELLELMERLPTEDLERIRNLGQGLLGTEQ